MNGSVELASSALLAAGSVLLQDVPGVGEETHARGLAFLMRSRGEVRVPCVPDRISAGVTCHEKGLSPRRKW